MGNSLSKPKIVTGQYLGYTQGGGHNQKPTLYFENGHLTQEHSFPTNVGWHPLPVGTVTHYIANIGKSKAVEVIQPTTADEKFIKSVVETNLPDLGDDEGPFLYEFGVNEEGLVPWHHPSRGKFMAKDDPASNPIFNSAYATDQMGKAKIAENEK